jgi:hypothetical protein
VKTHAARLVEVFIVATLVLNVIDATGTVLVLEKGLALEANPILQAAYEWGGIVALVAVKSILVASGSFILWRYRGRLAARLGAYVCFVTYWALVLWFWANFFI